MMKSLSSVFQRKSTLSKLYYRRKLLTLKCNEDTDLQDHFLIFDGIVRDLEGTGSTLDEDDKVCHLLLTMPERYNVVITVLETTTTALTLELVKSRLLDMELKMKNEKDEKKEKYSEECSFSANIKKKCYICNSENHLANLCPKRKESRENYRGKTRGKFRGGQRRLKYDNCSSSANVAKDKEEEISFVALTCANDNSEERGEDKYVNFVLDSGATSHLLSPKFEDHVTNIQNITPVYIKIANGETMRAEKSGKLKVSSSEGVKITIEVLIVKNLTFNLLSVKKINNAGFEVLFTKGMAKIKTKSSEIQCNESNNLFMVKFKIIVDSKQVCTSANITNNKDNLWHLRLGHINRRGLQLLGLPSSSENCNSCNLGKATRLPFKSRELPRSTRIGELIYSDVWGPAKTPTKNDERYYVTITDDFSHFTEVHLLKNKSDAENKLMNYIERQAANNIKVSRIRTDNGGEFSSHKFKTYCEERGIKQEFTAAYTPQQCGVAERLNRTILDKVRAMFVDTNLPKYLWGEAVRCAVYQINRCPTRALMGKIPADIYLKKIDYKKLKVFGSKVWVYSLPKGDKLEPRSKVMRMVGYSGPGYRMWDPETDKIIISRDTIFDETDYKFYENNANTAPNTRIDSSIEEEREPDNSQEIMDCTIQPDVEQESDSDDAFFQIPKRSPNKRQVNLPKKLHEYELYFAYCLLSSENDPLTYNEALESGPEWKKAIKNELEAHEKYKTWTPSILPSDKKAIDTKWVFRTKQDGVKKARLVAKGYQENSSENVYSPVAKMPTVRMFLSYALQNDWSIRQLDVPTAFLNGSLENVDIYIKVPEGVSVETGRVLKLNKALYGLRESPRCWNDCFDKFSARHNLKRSKGDVCLYTSKNLWLVLFVDDILLTGHDSEIESLIKFLKSEFNTKDMGELKCFLGTDIIRDKNSMKLCQQKLITKILQKYNMTDCKGVSTPMEVGFQFDDANAVNVPYREIVGSLNYLAMITRPDICYATAYLGRFLDKPTAAVWKAAKRILRYIKNTKNLKLTFHRSDKENAITAYADADWGSDKIDRKSVSGMAIYHNGNLISWSSKKQQTVALSTAEAEYLAAASCAAEILYLKNLAEDFSQNDVNTTLLVDNQSALAMIQNYENTKRSKHIDIKVHFIKDIVAKGLVKVNYIPTEKNVSDIFTKPLCKAKFIGHRDNLKII